MEGSRRKIKYNLVLIRAAAATARTNQDFAFSNYDGNKNKTFDGKQWHGRVEHSRRPRSLTHTHARRLFWLVKKNRSHFTFFFRSSLFASLRAIRVNIRDYWLWFDFFSAFVLYGWDDETINTNRYYARGARNVISGQLLLLVRPKCWPLPLDTIDRSKYKFHLNLMTDWARIVLLLVNDWLYLHPNRLMA